MRRFVRPVALVGSLLLAGSAISQAEVILRIDISDPSAVVFTATGAFAQNDDEDTDLTAGVTLIDFFSSEPDNVQAYFDPADLWSPEGRFAYEGVLNTSFSALLGPYTDLNLFGSGYSTQGFSTSQAALTGSAVLDLSEWIAHIRLGSGDLYAGDFSNSGPIIGQYEVIPEPTALSLIGAGAGAAFLLAARRWRIGRFRRAS
ncbi:MAG TPA: PEP-CTERM sorting domain-containing protein [Chthoniobacteraceae bacterium]|nr:PEP-CTERM sorting domain-containing protein [Chthoniobacteraceae bacterium]